jgi:diguanylate cyclase (GGDEF)-like protein
VSETRETNGHVRLATALDIALFVVGVLIGIAAVVVWLRSPAEDVTYMAAGAIALIVLLSRFPLTIPRETGDVVVGFETGVLVFMLLTQTSLIGPFAIWCIATTIANLSQRKVWRSRIFNVGITIICGALLVGVFAVLDPTDATGARGSLQRLVAVLVACAAFFLADLFLTAASLAIEDGCRITDVVSWNQLTLGLATFVSVDTLGFLAAELWGGSSRWVVALLIVPIGTILIAVRSVGEARRAHGRLEGLLEAATNAHEWADDEQIEKSLVVQAEKTLRHTTAVIRSEPPGEDEIGAAISMPGRPVRHLVVRHQVGGRTFDERDQAALEALTAVGISAYNRRRLSDEMTYLARHDALTGLANRSVFTERLDLALSAGRRQSVAVLYCDLDGFKEVNDLLGHRVGDELLTLAADRILGCIRQEDTAARLGGDEFGILLDQLPDVGMAHAVASRVLEVLNAPFHTSAAEVSVRVSIGIALNDDPAESAEVLINSADTAMYVAKARGKGRIEMFRPEMREAELDRLELEGALREAVMSDEIVVHYQPLVDLRTGEIDGFEALARWHHRTLGWVPPDVFIAAAERIGLIRQLGRQILERAHEGGRVIARSAGHPVSLGVNLSALQVADDALALRVRELQEDHPEVQLVLELTEGVMLSNDPATEANIQRLKASGAHLAIDDFGVGYSSVGYLHRLPVDIIKIDKLFVAQVHEPRSRALVEGVVSMARAMRLSIVVEGVEDGESARTLRDLGCDLGQGYLFSRPVDLADAMELAALGRLGQDVLAPQVVSDLNAGA